MTQATLQGSRNSLADIQQEIRKGYFLIAGLLLLFSIFVGVVPIKTAAIAPGQLIVEGEKKSVQHLEGGIIQQILVKEGDLVEEGQVLAKLDETRLRTEVNSLETQLILSQARKARWQAQLAGSKTLEFSPWLLDHRHNPQAASAMDDQQKLYTNSQELFKEQQKSFQLQIAQAQEKAHGSQQQLQQKKQQHQQIKQEIQNQQNLLAKGLVTRSLLLDLEERSGDAAINASELGSSATVYQHQAEQLSSELAKLEHSHLTEAAEKLDELGEQIATAEQSLIARQQQLTRASIRAPISGYVVNMQVNTQGGVLGAGQTLMEIIPSKGSMVVEAQIPPKDRDVVQIGQPAEIRFSAFKQNAGLPIQGKVKLISADIIKHPEDQSPYYKTLIELDMAASQLPDNMTLHPGMQAEVMIVTGEKTLMSYISSPLTASFNRALTEN